MHAAVVKAVDEYVGRRTVRRDARLAQIVNEDREVLDHLADA